MKKFANVLQPLAVTATTMVASFALLQSAPAQAANLITNGDFAAGNFTGWTMSNINNQVHTYVANGANGTMSAFLGNQGSLAFLSQTVNTIAGQNYTLSYDFLSDGKTPNQFQVKVNGNTLFDQTDIAAQAFTSYSFSFVGTGADKIQFGERNDPAYLQLDNVVVSSQIANQVSSQVPEPFTIVGTLVGGTTALRMRKKLKSSNKA